MQKIYFYVAGEEVLCPVRDFSNLKPEAAPILICGCPVELHMRVMKDLHTVEPYPLEAFSAVMSWGFVMDDDFDRDTPPKIVADGENITVSDVLEPYVDPETGITINRHHTEFKIPLPYMNTEALHEWMDEVKERTDVFGELVGYDSSGDPTHVFQIYGFSVRNRLTDPGPPTDTIDQYLTLDAARALIAAAQSSFGELIFEEVE